MSPELVRAAAEELIARTVVARGLPRTVADPVAIARLAGLVRDTGRPGCDTTRAAREPSRHAD